ncbi:79_t:CDS:2 [Acaulospora colombiana]|uniref:79_t:CDS:1 n=1 Tax=Acaulospora colombiana TaxID=27376 RepID=A0ACA9KDL5_9GLOM|nr:79_t:CDS:2 [Acaulospora colombiana]
MLSVATSSLSALPSTIRDSFSRSTSDNEQSKGAPDESQKQSGPMLHENKPDSSTSSRSNDSNGNSNLSSHKIPAIPIAGDQQRKIDEDGSSTTWQDNLAGSRPPTTNLDITTITTTTTSNSPASLNIEHFDFKENELPTKRRKKRSTFGTDSVLDDSSFYMDSPSIGGFAPANPKRNAEFHALFRSVPENDYLINESEYAPNKSSEELNASSESCAESSEEEKPTDTRRKFGLPKLTLPMKFMRNGGAALSEDERQIPNDLGQHESKVHSLPSSPQKSEFDEKSLLKGSKGHRPRSKSVTELQSPVSDLSASEIRSPRTQSLSIDAKVTGTVEKLYNLLLTSEFVNRYLEEEEKCSGTIESACVEGQATHWKNLIQYIKKYIAAHPSEFKDESMSAGRERAVADSSEVIEEKRQAAGLWNIVFEIPSILYSILKPMIQNITVPSTNTVIILATLFMMTTNVYNCLLLRDIGRRLDNVAGGISSFTPTGENEFNNRNQREIYSMFDDRVENEDVLWQWLTEKSRRYENSGLHDDSVDDAASSPSPSPHGQTDSSSLGSACDYNKSPHNLYEEIENLHKMLWAAESRAKKLIDVAEYESAYYQEQEGKIKKHES